MAKAIAGAALIVGAVVLDVVSGGTLTALSVAMIQAGISMEAAAIASALSNNRGMNISTRMPAGLRQIVYGMQRIGGTNVYQSTTGAEGHSGNYVYNYVVAVATHVIDAYVNIYLDGRQVFFAQDGAPSNIGCGMVTNPPVCTVTISGGAVVAISATAVAPIAANGFANVAPTGLGYRVRIYGGGGSGAQAWGTWSGSAWSFNITAAGSGYTSAPSAEVEGAYTFGGTAAADQQDPTQPGYGLGYGIGPDGTHYNFAGKVYAEARFGDQPPGDYMAALSVNDPVWPTSARGAGVAYLYISVGYDTDQFPAPPEMRITITGKNDIYDPRTGKTGYSQNWALQVADVLGNMNNVVGVQDGPISSWPTDALNQLIAAANVCDEIVTTSQGEECRWQQHIHFETSNAPGSVLAMMMPSAQGRLTRSSGGWYIWPAYWQGPSFAFDESDLVGTPQWMPYRSFRDLVNRVNGTYIAPNYPYGQPSSYGLAPFGNLYDSNGWYYGTTNDLWPFAWQPTSFPQYAADVLHGYAADEYLEQDGGIQLPDQLDLRGVISVVQAQRCAKVRMMRNRFQGVGNLPMSFGAYVMMPLDIMEFSFPLLGLSGAYLEVAGDENQKLQLLCAPLDAAGESGGDRDRVPALYLQVPVRLTDPTIYEWSETEELTPMDVPASPSQIPSNPAAPTSFSVTSSAATALIGPDGVVTPRAQLAWTAPADITVTQIEIQYQLYGASAWLAGGLVDVALFEAYVTGVIAGQEYNFQIRSLRASGSASPWVQALAVPISITLSITVTSGTVVAPAGTLLAYAVSGGTCDIVVMPFTAQIGGLSVACLPAGPYTITGLLPQSEYSVYFIDPNFQGGAITPIATLNPADYLNKVGYFLIGTIETPAGSSIIYRPSAFAVSGPLSSSVTGAANAYDGSPATVASIPALWYTTGCPSCVYTALSGTASEWSGFPAGAISGSKTLNVELSALFSGTVPSGSIVVTASIAGSPSTLATLTATTSLATYQLTVPSGTDLSTVTVTVMANITAGSSAGTGSVAAQVAEIWIQ